jgi:hypothetical protein
VVSANVILFGKLLLLLLTDNDFLLPKLFTPDAGEHRNPHYTTLFTAPLPKIPKSVSELGRQETVTLLQEAFTRKAKYATVKKMLLRGLNAPTLFPK